MLKHKLYFVLENAFILSRELSRFFLSEVLFILV